MYFALLLSVSALSLAFVNGSPILFVSTLVLVFCLAISRMRASSQSLREYQRVQKLLTRNRKGASEECFEEQVRTLLWQVSSTESVGGDLQELAATLLLKAADIRKRGLEGLHPLPEFVTSLTRSEHVVLALFGDSAHEVIGIPSRLKEGEKVGERLADLALQLTAYSAPLDSQIYDIDESESSLFRFWPDSKHILFVYAPIHSDEESKAYLGLFLGYPARVLPLPREKEIVREVVRVSSRAVREFNTVREISDRAKVEKKEQEKYFAHISHDIRTPLNNIQAILDLFYLEGVTDRNKQFLQVARSNCRSLRDIVEELLEFTKYKDGHLQVQRQQVRVSEVVEEVIDEFSLSAEIKGVELTSSVNPRLGVEVDRKHLKRILMNLVSNGIKYTERGSVDVVMELENGEVVISVSDTGVGIPWDKQEKLFVPFSRLGEVKVEGIGLGLTLTKILVESNGGNISVESRHGKGSTFTIRFAAIDAAGGIAETSQVQDPIDPEGVSSRASRARVLVIDDDLDACRTLARLLDQLGYETQTLHRLADLRGLLNFWKPEVVVSDVEIPDGGIEKVLGIADFHDIPVLALTGCVDKEKLELLLECGVRKILKKPVNPRELQACIDAESKERLPDGVEDSPATRVAVRN